MNKYLDDIKFDESYINKCKNKLDIKLVDYITNSIMDEYDLNDKGHNKNHINFVLKRAFEISKDYNIDYNILYTCVSFHDIACHIDRENHEKLSAKRVYEDEFLNNYFSAENMLIIKEAIEDHRASTLDIPRNIYGKILSSADRKVSIKEYFISSLFFGESDIYKVDMNKAINKSYDHAIKKFGKEGYATNKFYVDDIKYKEFLNKIQYLIDNKNEFYKLAEIVFNEVKGGNYE